MQAPEISEVRQIELPNIEKFTLSNGIPLWILHDPLAEYVRLDVTFLAGRHQESAQMTSKAAALLLKEGSQLYTGKEISKFFDAKGANLSIRSSLDHLFISFTSLTEYGVELMKVMADLCLDPSYQADELEKYKRRQSQKLDIELSKTEVVAYREMTAAIYGQNAPYGYNSTRSGYMSLERSKIIDFYHRNIRQGQKHIFVTGNVTDKMRSEIDAEFGNEDFKPRQFESPIDVPVISNIHQGHFDMPSAVQTSVRVFRPLFNRHHVDYSRLFLLNIIFGGYFGSRLMKNIREEKGLTYGIYASLDTLKHSGYFYISTETSHENVKLVLKLINEEMEKLSQFPCDEEELLMVKRYIAGQFLRMMDGPLNVMKVYRTLALDELPDHHYNELLESIWSCRAEELQEISQRYLKPDHYSLITVGKIISDPSGTA